MEDLIERKLMEKFFGDNWEVDLLSKRGCTLYTGESDVFGLAFHYDDSYGDTIHIENLVVYSKRGQGMGTKIMQEIIAWAKENEYKAISLVAFPLDDSDWPMSRWAALLNWYERLGFIYDNEIKGYDPKYPEKIRKAAEKGLTISEFKRNSRPPKMVLYLVPQDEE